jgi:ferredoxin-NADP reductase/predicted pyridoxine 5'-phosphate oxidase superfamily flavin-nucleotide-binding protein
MGKDEKASAGSREIPMMVSPNDRKSAWHAGEVEMQRRVGVADRMREIGKRVMRDHLIDQHREFYPLLPFVVLGAVDEAGDAWATLRAGRPGFLRAVDERHLHLDLKRDPADPADAGMEAGDAMGLLGIDLRSRRRNRLNGTVARDGADGFDLAVVQSFGNCPQYIQLRDFSFVRAAETPPSASPRYLDRLDDRACAMIEAADTFFVASYVDIEGANRQVDVSHRGGRTGFVRVGADGALTIPDFAGNLFFNTLGNILANPKAGLVFPDFATGDLLQLTGDAEVIADSPEIAAFQGAERLWRFKPRRIVHRAEALPLRWSFQDRGQQAGWSPNSLMTGNWAEAAGRLQAAALADTWRPFRVAKIVDESAAIRSFHLVPADGGGIIPHSAGQHLPIRVTPPGRDAPVIRTYTLSVAPSDRIYRISVKREGVVSRYLHEAIRVGDTIEARAPDGGFTIDARETRPAVLLAAGVGVTPMIAMLRHVVYEGLRKRALRPTFFFHASRKKHDRAFDSEIAALVEAGQGSIGLVRVISDPEGATLHQDYDYAGRIDIALLKAALPFNDYDFYLCGPAGFMQSLYDGLRGLNIADARIHAETFGPASLRRRPDARAAALPSKAPAGDPVSVAFMKSGKEARWAPESGSLLELAEARGLAPEFSCRKGECGTCRTRILNGAVAYTTAPTAPVGENEALICCSVPAASEDGGSGLLQLDL